MQFKTSFDKTAIMITVLFTALFVFIIGIQYLVDASNHTSRSVYVIIILVLLYCLAFAFHPSGYYIAGDVLLICRPVGKVRIKRTDIKSVAILEKKELSRSIRTFGVGGLFGYYGCFANRALGSMTWYATRKDKAVLIVTGSNKKIVVTPDEPEAFLAAFTA